MVQQGLEMRGFWVQKKTVQLKTALREVYTYVLKGFFFQKTVYLQGFCQNPRISRLVLCSTRPLNIKSLNQSLRIKWIDKWILDLLYRMNQYGCFNLFSD